MRELLCGQALGLLELRALGVGDREQAALAVLLERDTEDLGGQLLALADEVQRRPRRPEAARAQREHVTPHRGEQRSPKPGATGYCIVGTALEARDQHHRHL